MSLSQQKQVTEPLLFFITNPEPCSYIENQSSRLLFIDPNQAVDEKTLSELSRHGFRRNGEIMYKPDCDGCHQCLSSRIPVSEFTMNSSQKKAWKRNQDVTLNIISSAFASYEHFDLYREYVKARHNENRESLPDENEFENFLMRSNNNSIFIEFRLNQQLIGVSLCDFFDDGISAVYTFFDPSYQRRSLGVFAILTQIEYVKSLGLSYLYLGYWVPHSSKMQYKSKYQPLEILFQNEWLRLKQPLSDEDIQRFGNMLAKNMYQSPLLFKPPLLDSTTDQPLKLLGFK